MFRKAVRSRGQEAFEQLALDFTATQTCAALRVGEVTGAPIAVLAPGSVRLRGDAWGWPDEAGLRTAPPLRGLRRIDLTDARRRFAVLGEDLDAA